MRIPLRHFTTAVLLAQAAVLAPSVALATVPQGLTEQGRLFDDTGDPLNTLVSLTFSIYGAASGGAALWTETQPSVVLDLGYFSAELGDATPIPQSVWTGATLYVGVAVNADPEMTPRQPTYSVPYALVTNDVIGAIHPTTVSVNGQLVIDASGDWVGPSSGLVGPTGPAGAIGSTGAAGATGTTGGTGPAGSAGPQGPQGPVGPPGLPGATGTAGPAGANGAQGAEGPQGSPGATGAQGATGAEGATGATGPTGTAGAVGLTGPIGPQGPAGANGVAGANGAQGATGAPGASGAQGGTGASGVQGGVGPTGPTGAQGANGAQGAAGANGTPGAPGAQGATGSSGTPGAQGATGSSGTPGAQGSAGLQGPTGATGAQGATGSSGTPGAQGSAGGQGPMGATGAQGATGPQGPSSGLTWSSVSSNLTASSNQGYFVSGAALVTVTLPASCALGDTVIVAGGPGSSGWILAPASGQTFLGLTNVVTSGPIDSNSAGDVVQVVCAAVGTQWKALWATGSVAFSAAASTTKGVSWVNIGSGASECAAVGATCVAAYENGISEPCTTAINGSTYSATALCQISTADQGVSWVNTGSGNSECAAIGEACLAAYENGVSEPCGTSINGSTYSAAALCQVTTGDQGVYWSNIGSGSGQCATIGDTCVTAYENGVTESCATAINGSSYSATALCQVSTGDKGVYWTDTGSGSSQCALIGATCVAAYESGIAEPCTTAINGSSYNATALCQLTAGDQGVYWTNTGSGSSQCALAGATCVAAYESGVAEPCTMAINGSSYNATALCQLTAGDRGVYWTNTGSGNSQCALIGDTCVAAYESGIAEPCTTAINGSSYNATALCQ